MCKWEWKGRVFDHCFPRIQGEPDKVGAGLFILCEPAHEVLLLKRSATSGNPGTWGVPGGNVRPAHIAATVAILPSAPAPLLPPSLTLVSHSAAGRPRGEPVALRSARGQGGDGD